MASNANNGKNKNFAQAARHALSGLANLVRTERNARIDLIAGCLAIIAGLILHLEWYRWVVLGICILAVIAAETMNTAIEALANAIAPDHRDVNTGRAKDLAAGAVLLVCIAVFLCGLWLFGPALLTRLQLI
jgi:diacylglycerol kinase (ATP)